jgi:hypothetical protein
MICWESRKEREVYEDLKVGGRRIKINHRETRFGGVGSNYLPQGRDQRRALVNSVMNLHDM